ncbi:MAG: helix-turn-helix transcriptional regulator [Burkholderia sp.]|jgi:AraC-like DNA-binding protein|uniref:helix-turn-helix transcriptional regulator n=3 Tax=Burkholderia sp. TaxID=36773 RepID=UPI00258378B3|nr:helix-turn-helix transcriptional regulator [Burkholderia sp.]MCA3783283.1 helix-turn-helix transcriptional regulator [Burkholderia sp.]MCA3786991.1 helix-turn-helix transcriptional regulator [Burkholderia sp.]MCA3796191.1 helix-turn-helix transcriptional regulator [Burkholderia sp.]MCA3801604.1 helix-turn-helix transcriptional regulator [Burkholderia sp.]MCA3813258.1 helix-turn-helix transcriptional regulator [Burkholderia sp.]
MFSSLYFPLVSVLACHDAQPDHLDMLLDGRIAETMSYTSRCTEQCDHDESGASGCLQIQADLQTMLGIDEDAEDSYREAQKMIRSSRRDLRIASCRNAGWQAFFRHRLGTAMSCFMSIVDDPRLEPRQAMEGRFGALCVLLELGQLHEAEGLLVELEVMLDAQTASGHAALPQLPVWRELIDTLRYDLGVQNALRTAAQLSDHVFWQSGLTARPAAGKRSHEHDAGPFAARAARVRSPLLRSRIDYLDQLQRLAAGQREASPAAIAHLNWAMANGLYAYQYAVRIEIALASLAGGAPQLAEAMLAPLAADRRAAQGRWKLESLYCLAKTRTAQGRDADAAQLYSRYALVAMQCLRDASAVLAPFAHRAKRVAEQLDDVGARLPAKYRRAYRYLMENLERSDLSVREVAAEIGVTERALQSAFKNSLGSTPTEIIRQKRMERIRAELESDTVLGVPSVLFAAARWGVQSRSTLVNGYRRQFDEAPSDTLKR